MFELSNGKNCFRVLHWLLSINFGIVIIIISALFILVGHITTLSFAAKIEALSYPSNISQSVNNSGLISFSLVYADLWLDSFSFFGNAISSPSGRIIYIILSSNKDVSFNWLVFESFTLKIIWLSVVLS